MKLRDVYEQKEANERVKEEIYENQICSAVGQQLIRYYPNWKWWVECRLRTGLITVRNLSLRGEYGFVLPITTFINETTPKIIMRAGGEILERFNQSREGRHLGDTIQRDFTGGAIGDLDAKC